MRIKKTGFSFRSIIFVIIFLLFSTNLLAQENFFEPAAEPQKFALVIGNGNYTGLSRLANPVNDADDIAAALETLGFTVDKLLDASQEQMDGAVIRLKNRLSLDHGSYGFFFYAGHGVQSGGENYLIPVNANIPDENFLRSRAVSVQAVLDVLNDARNSLNVVVLDACRDNPFGWSRSGARGLAVTGRQPADSIIVYATSSGQTASDGQGRNGLFTSSLLGKLATPGLEVSEMFRLTGADVAEVSGRRQIPAIYNQFFGTAYLGPRPQGAFETGSVLTAVGSLLISTVSAGKMEITGANLHRSLELPEWGHLPIETISAGNYRVVMRYEDGRTEEKTVTVGREEIAALEFSYRSKPPRPPREPRPPRPAKPPREPRPAREPRVMDIQAARLNSIGFSLGSGFTAPLFVGTVRGTFAPTKFSFLEAGADIGGLSSVPDTGYFSVYPYIRYAAFVPFPVLPSKKSAFGWYAGIGGGWMLGRHTSAGDRIPVSIPAFEISSGFILWNSLDLSWSMRTNFNGVNHKVSLGYFYRFK